ncbi:hypothetical protein DFP72DRAFT_904766 [Ephemerocybe angulata]|uniref:Uncharacterized protein n=1 Tax=Ephemerocybe angulata TaxID=980116 RepID=A0A8H6M426_9AGAR|nr:hypothetical protein DFP72DRAFT_904766 [Tulosesus angulatus]
MDQATSTRKRASQSHTIYPPPRRSRGLRHDISLPLMNTSLWKVIYALVAFTTLLTAFYAYRTVQHKREVGGWWNLALGRKPPTAGMYGGHEQEGVQYQSGAGNTGQGKTPSGDVEDKIHALAMALGMPSNELASAIALAVRNYVPPASLSSVAAKETGSAVKVLVEGALEEFEEAVPVASPTATGVISGIVEGVEAGFENFVGMEEP